jgi:hypothetical protein
MYDVAKTCIKQVPALFKKIEWQRGTTNLDIGGGKYDLGTEYLSEQGVTNLVFDCYNRSAEHQSCILEWLRQNQADTITMSNVLNVIYSEIERFKLLQFAYKSLKADGKCYISVYEGDCSGIGKCTRINTWQENRRLTSYMNEVQEVFRYVVLDKKNKMIIASKKEVF